MNSDPLKTIAQEARAAGMLLAGLSTQIKNRALAGMAKHLIKNQAVILEANAKDIRAAKAKGMKLGLINRLALDEYKISRIADSLVLISKLPDPVGRVISKTTRPNGLQINKIGVPIGVILIIYESRPNVTSDCMALCLKSGNSVILKGGSETLHSNAALFKILQTAAMEQGVPQGAFQLVATPGRGAVRKLLDLSPWIDLVIPRGGEGLIRAVTRVSKIPVIKHAKGICHVFLDASADFEKSMAITLNAKTQNPSVCNAMETLLVHEKVAKRYLPKICLALEDKGVELRGDEAAQKIVPGIKRAAEKDWASEYLDLILSIRVVKDLKEAVQHIQKYGSQHSDAIVTENDKAAGEFTRSVDSACVFVNCSTRFSDGGEFGMGAEMGISTGKLHARGPMGLEELTSYKYVVLGNGQVRK